VTRDNFDETFFELQIQDFPKNSTVDRRDRELPNGRKIPKSDDRIFGKFCPNLVKNPIFGPPYLP